MRAHLILFTQTTRWHQTIQTIENDCLVANCLYVNTLYRKPDNLTIFFVFSLSSYFLQSVVTS